jgi:hypothetical protein
MRGLADLDELLEDLRAGPEVEPEVEPFAHIRSVHVVAEVLHAMLGLTRDAALVAAEQQIRRLACERLVDWTPNGLHS